MLEYLLSSQAWLQAGLIFGLRVANMSLDTVRIMMVLRGRKWSAWIFGFIQTMIYVAVLTSVIKDLTNFLNLIAYAGGYATGNVVGMWFEERLAIGHINMRIISPNLGTAIAERLRNNGYAVTETPARGKDGAVTLLNVSIYRRQVSKIMSLVQETDPEAFITSEDVRPVRRGFWRA
ncbi:MAG: DUF2179 domain-containing protein [Chloroflexi bacterium]|nr:DUF2179 domain-containing protein [Chloroflexota bacterium]